jgi:hypothetical protein
MMTHDEFIEKECPFCGTQRCYGVEFCNKYKVNVFGEKDDYDPYTGKYAFVSPDEICCEAKEVLREAKDALLYMLVLHDSTHGHNMQEAVQILYRLQSDNRWNVQKAKEVLKKISEYCEQEGTE